MKLKLFLAALVIAAMSGCAQKGGWQEKHIKGGVVFMLESDEVIQNDTLNGKASLMVGISPKNDTSYCVFIPSKSTHFDYREAWNVDDYVIINNQKYWLPMLPIWTTNGEPDLGISYGYGIDFDKQTTPNLLSMPQIEVSYYHNETPIKMTFKAK